MSQQLQLSIQGESQIQSDSYKLKLNFIERSLQKAKDQNGKLLQKIQKLQKQNQRLIVQSKSFNQPLAQLNEQLKKKEKDIQGLLQKLEIRTRRYESEQSQNINKNEKQQFQRKIKRSQDYALLCKSQKESFSQKCKSLMSELEQSAREKVGLIAKNQYLSSQLVRLEAEYLQKIKIVESQKSQLRKQVQSLTLQLKLLQRRKQIQVLLNYENNIGMDSYAKSIFSETTTQRSYSQQKSQQNQYCCCQQLQQQLQEAEQLISLLKQRNTRLIGELQSVKKRCNVLQGIICSSPG